MDDYCNQGKDDYSDIQDRALGARYVRYDAQTNYMGALGSLIFLLEQIVRLTNKSVVCITFYSSCIY